jgi:hypothetical protein
MSLNDIPVRDLNERLSNLERCAQKAPVNTYQFAKNVADIIDELSNDILGSLKSHGLHAANNDELRRVEAAIYGYIIASNPNLASGFAVSEGFGEHCIGPAGDRVIAQAERDRDARVVIDTITKETS